MNRYDNLSKTGYRFSLDQFDENKKTHLAPHGIVD